MNDVLFDGYDPPPPVPDPGEELGVDARRTLRRLRILEDGRHPLKGDRLHPDAAPVADRQADGRRCGNCAHSYTSGGSHANRSYVKCDRVPETHGSGTDLRAWWPACIQHTPQENEVTP